MAKKHEIIKQLVAATTTETKTYPAVPDGKTVVLKMFGAADINNGDNKSSVYILQWGSAGSFQTIRVLALTGNTQDIEMKRPLRGDGTKFLRVLSQNNSSSSKELVFWFEAEQG